MAMMQGTGGQRTLATVVLVGTIVFLYQLAMVFAKIESWEVLWNPPTVSQMLVAVVAGLCAVAAALGINLGVLAGPLLKGLGFVSGGDGNSKE